jgi:hypothetical protein
MNRTLAILVALFASAEARLPSTPALVKKKTLTPNPTKKLGAIDAALSLPRGGADLTEIAKNAVFFTSGFMLLPAGRDLVATGAHLMPGDDKLFAAMHDDDKKPAYKFMWQVWGLNWICLSIMNILAVKEGSMDFMRLAFGGDVLRVGLLLKDKAKFDGAGADIAPFLGLFVIEMVALGQLVLGNN